MRPQKTHFDRLSVKAVIGEKGADTVLKRTDHRNTERVWVA